MNSLHDIDLLGVDVIENILDSAEEGDYGKDVLKGITVCNLFMSQVRGRECRLRWQRWRWVQLL